MFDLVPNISCSIERIFRTFKNSQFWLNILLTCQRYQNDTELKDVSMTQFLISQFSPYSFSLRKCTHPHSLWSHGCLRGLHICNPALTLSQSPTHIFNFLYNISTWIICCHLTLTWYNWNPYSDTISFLNFFNFC